MRRRPHLRVLASGPLSVIQDLGRPGWFNSGVGVSGAADRRSHTLANRLVGNQEGAATIECLMGGLELYAIAPVIVAVTGAPAPIAVDGTPTGHSSVIVLERGRRLRLGMAKAGMRIYVAVRGGIDVDPVLGSRSHDTLSGLGPEPLSTGTELSAGDDTICDIAIDVAPVATIDTVPITAHVIFGPRDDWFRRPRDLLVGWWEASDSIDRVGARLNRPRGFPALTRHMEKELPTEGMPLGAIQVPPSGEPVVFLADHPITGGYPVVATVVDRDLDLIAQARPGQHIIFRQAIT
ncbi:MAG: biotin-dependent carboxyltransferase family protein [Mycobacterium sp.]